MRKRRKARELCLQQLYALEIASGNLEKRIDAIFAEIGENTDIAAFASSLLRKTVEYKDELDREVKELVANWEFDRIALVDRLIMRMAFCEICHFKEIPPKVTINEAIELAKMYSTEKSSKFVNGILDSFYKKLKKEQKIHKVGRGLL